MPDFGRLSADRLPHTTPVAAPLYPPPPWSLPGAEILKVTFEIDKDVCLNWLPPSLGRTSPAYAHVIIARYPESPVGPFSLATQYLGCRSRMFVRAYTVQAVTDNEAALSALRETWGFPCKLGRVELSRKGGAVEAGVERGGRRLVAVSFSDGAPIDAESVRFDPVLNLRLVPAVQEGKPPALVELAQIGPAYTIREALRGKAAVTYPEPSEGDPWHLLQPLYPIAAVFVVADTELPYARFVQPY
ncbi:MAG: acetoacetate decarboxylase family protein [Chloroflexi bacterium]|nr:acetoacetate decarboxylase family protein [Chloroflexota bacterium]